MSPKTQPMSYTGTTRICVQNFTAIRRAVSELSCKDAKATFSYYMDVFQCFLLFYLLTNFVDRWQMLTLCGLRQREYDADAFSWRK